MPWGKQAGDMTHSCLNASLAFQSCVEIELAAHATNIRFPLIICSGKKIIRLFD